MLSIFLNILEIAYFSNKIKFFIILISFFCLTINLIHDKNMLLYYFYYFLTPLKMTKINFPSSSPRSSAEHPTDSRFLSRFLNTRMAVLTPILIALAACSDDSPKEAAQKAEESLIAGVPHTIACRLKINAPQEEIEAQALALAHKVVDSFVTTDRLPEDDRPKVSSWTEMRFLQTGHKDANYDSEVRQEKEQHRQKICQAEKEAPTVSTLSDALKISKAKRTDVISDEAWAELERNRTIHEAKQGAKSFFEIDGTKKYDSYPEKISSFEHAYQDVESLVKFLNSSELSFEDIDTKKEEFVDHLQKTLNTSIESGHFYTADPILEALKPKQTYYKEERVTKPPFVTLSDLGYTTETLTEKIRSYWLTKLKDALAKTRSGQYHATEINFGNYDGNPDSRRMKKNAYAIMGKIKITPKELGVSDLELSCLTTVYEMSQAAKEGSTYQGPPAKFLDVCHVRFGDNIPAVKK